MNAPEAITDDQADAYALTVAALAWQPAVGTSTVEAKGDPLAEYDRGRC